MNEGQGRPPNTEAKAMTSAIRKFVVPTVISQLVALLIVVQAVFAIALPAYLSIDPDTGYTAAYTYASLFIDEGVMIPLAER